MPAGPVNVKAEAAFISKSKTEKHFELQKYGYARTQELLLKVINILIPNQPVM